MAVLTKLRVFLQLQRGLLFRYGWLRAWWVGKPVNRNGDPLPWITYPAIDFLSQFDFADASVFEWGSGFSTLWWAKRCKSITTVESGPNWIPYIRPMLPASVKFLTPAFTETEEVRALYDEDRMYDVIVIDNNGPFRAACADAAVGKLAAGGMILLDNSDQCLKTCSVLRGSGFTQIDFTGFVPGNGYAHCTSVFFKNTLKFSVSGGSQPHQSPAQPNPPWEGC